MAAIDEAWCYPCETIGTDHVGGHVMVVEVSAIAAALDGLDSAQVEDVYSGLFADGIRFGLFMVRRVLLGTEGSE